MKKKNFIFNNKIFFLLLVILIIPLIFLQKPKIKISTTEIWSPLRDGMYGVGITLTNEKNEFIDYYYIFNAFSVNESTNAHIIKIMPEKNYCKSGETLDIQADVIFSKPIFASLSGNMFPTENYQKLYPLTCQNENKTLVGLQHYKCEVKCGDGKTYGIKLRLTDETQNKIYDYIMHWKFIGGTENLEPQIKHVNSTFDYPSTLYVYLASNNKTQVTADTYFTKNWNGSLHINDAKIKVEGASISVLSDANEEIKLSFIKKFPYDKNKTINLTVNWLLSFYDGSFPYEFRWDGKKYTAGYKDVICNDISGTAFLILYQKTGSNEYKNVGESTLNWVISNFNESDLDYSGWTSFAFSKSYKILKNETYRILAVREADKLVNLIEQIEWKKNVNLEHLLHATSGLIGTYEITGNYSYVNATENVIRKIEYFKNADGLYTLGIFNGKRDFSVYPNLNARLAVILYKLGKITGNETYIEDAEKISEWILENQNPDGSFHRVIENSTVVDFPHTVKDYSYTLCSLSYLGAGLKKGGYSNSVENGINYSYIFLDTPFHRIADGSGGFVAEIEEDFKYDKNKYSCANSLMLITLTCPECFWI